MGSDLPPLGFQQLFPPLELLSRRRQDMFLHVHNRLRSTAQPTTAPPPPGTSATNGTLIVSSVSLGW